MTLPEQSDRAVAQTREFLVRLASPYGEGAIKGIRREVRAEASRLLRHYPLSWNGDCPEQDNRTNADTVGRTLAQRITGLQPTLEIAKLQAEVRRLEGVITAGQAALTDEEREAVKRAADALSGVDDWSPDESEKDNLAVAALRGLLQRLGGGR
jgi:hypothetical protein